MRLHAFCLMGGSDAHASVTDEHGSWRVPTSFLPLLRARLDAELASRYQRDAPARARTMLMLPAYSIAFDHLQLGRLLNDASLRQRLTTAQQQTLASAGRLAVGFRYTPTLGALLCNHARVARFAHDQIQHILGAPCVCQLRGAAVQDFIPQGHAHVVTCDARVITGGQDAALVDRLRWLFQRGARHRPDALEVIMSPAVRVAIVGELTAALTALAGRVPGLGPAQGWVADIVARVQHMLNSHQRFADGRVLSTVRRAYAPGTPSVVWEDAFEGLVSMLHQDFVITTADKINKNLVVVCRKYYIEQVLADLRSGLFYTPCPGGAAAAVAHLAAQLQQHCAHMFEFGVDSWVLQGLHKLPYASCLIKLHKQPVSFRFLACSRGTGLQQPAVWAARMLRVLQGDLDALWSALLRTTGVAWADTRPWFINTTTQLVDLVRRFNGERMHIDAFRRGGGWQGADVVRLFTNIPHDGLMAALRWCVRQSFQRHPGDVLVVFWDTSVEHEERWRPPPTLPGSWGEAYQFTNPMHSLWIGRHRRHGRFCVFDEAGALACLQLLVQNAFVTFGGLVFHQHKGIPMGINPAVFLANYYLFWYEFQFVERLATIINTPEHQPLHAPGDFAPAQHFVTTYGLHDAPQPQHQVSLGDLARYVLQCFCITGRYVDDFTSGPNPVLGSLRYTSQSILGGHITGIYPDGEQGLELQPVGGPDDCMAYPTLDVRIVTDVDPVTGVCCAHTILYDKRREPCYANIPVVQYSHAASAVTAGSGRNVLMGQLHRFTGVIMDRANFVIETARCFRDLVAGGHARRALERVLHRFCASRFFLYGDTHVTRLRGDVLRAVDAVLAGAAAP